MNKWNNLLDHTCKEDLISSILGHIISGSPEPRGVLYSDEPDDIENADSAIPSYSMNWGRITVTREEYIRLLTFI